MFFSFFTAAPFLFNSSFQGKAPESICGIKLVPTNTKQKEKKTGRNIVGIKETGISVILMDTFHTHTCARARTHARAQDSGQFSRCALILAYVFDQRAI